MNDGQIVFEIKADGSKAKDTINQITKQMQQAANKWDDNAGDMQDNVHEITDTINREGQKWSRNVEQNADSMQSAMNKAFDVNRIKEWALQAGKAVLDFAKEAISAASDLDEVQNVVDVTFGDAAGQIQSWANKAGKQFGLTETQAKKFTSTLGAMAKSSGIASNDIVKMSTDLAGLAADMASFYNLDFETAFEKIKSGITGETEPLKALGINMSAANLEAFALQQGLEKTFSKMDQGEQTLLRYQYLMSATADAQGDFSRTSDGYANSLRKMETNIESLKTKIGKILVPAMSDGIAAINGLLETLMPTDSRTVLDEFEDINLNTSAKIQAIQETAQEARDLVFVLDSIAGEKTTAANAAVEKIATDISNISLDQGKPALVNELLTTLTANITALEEATGKDKDSVQEWLNGIATQANSLEDGKPEDWDTLINTIISGIPGLENTTAGQELLQTLQGIENTKAGEALKQLEQDLGSIDLTTGKPAIVKQTLETLKGDIEALAAVRGESSEGVQAWLGGIADKANSLEDGKPEEWESLINTIVAGIPGLENTTAGQGLLKTLKGIEESKAGSALQTLSDKLGEIDLSKGKAGVVKDTIATLAANIDTLSDVTGEDATGVSEWLSNVSAAADGLTDGTTSNWTALAEMLKQGIPGIEDTEGGKSIIEAITGQVGKIGEISEETAKYLESLGISTDGITDKNQLWLETCKRLVGTIPGLASIINTETGEIKGGTQAIKDYITAWETGETKLAMMAAHEQKQNALSQKFSELPMLQLDYAVARKRVRDSFATVKALFDQYGVGLGFDENGKIVRNFNQYGLQAKDIQELNAAIDDLEKKEKEMNAAKIELDTQTDAFNEAKEALAYEAETIEEMPDGLAKATDAAEDWGNAMKSAGKTAVESSEKAITALTDYYQKARDAISTTVGRLIGGVEKVTRPTQEIDKQISDLNKQLQNAKKGSEEYIKIQKQIDELNKKKDDQGYTGKGMLANLKSQKAFMEEYLKNLAKAREMGISDQLLASLSDGTAESAERLNALIADPEMAKQIDDLYKEVNGMTDNFTDTLAKQKMAVDEIYQKMVDKAKEAVGQLDLNNEAADATGKTVSGLAQGISDHVPEVSLAVKSILTELDRLSKWGVSIDLGTFGKFGFQLDGSFATGLDYVPFNGFLAELHEGEGILTAEENRIWQRFKDGGAASQNVDYDALGGVMRDNVHAGGNVYLDGRTVGRVISEEQGASYRTLKRSGWQS